MHGEPFPTPAENSRLWRRPNRDYCDLRHTDADAPQRIPVVGPGMFEQTMPVGTEGLPAGRRGQTGQAPRRGACAAHNGKRHHDSGRSCIARSWADLQYLPPMGSRRCCAGGGRGFLAAGGDRTADRRPPLLVLAGRLVMRSPRRSRIVAGRRNSLRRRMNRTAVQTAKRADAVVYLRASAPSRRGGGGRCTFV